MRIRQLLLASTMAACAAAGAQPAAVSLAQVQRAAAANPDVSIARRALAAAQGDVLAADHAPVPVLSAKASSIDLQNGIGPGNAWRDKRIDKSLGVDVTLERGNKRELRTRAAQAAAEAARADVREAMVQQQIAASGAWFDLRAAQEKLVQVEAVRQGAAQLAANAQRRQRAGDLSKQETARIEIEAERAGADVRAAEADRAKAAAALAQLTGLPLPLQADEWPAAGVAAPTAGRLDDRADVIAATQRVEAARAALEGARALRKADVTVGASLDHFPGTSTRQLEVRLQVPIAAATGYGWEGEIARAAAQLAQAEDQLEKVRRAANAEMQRLRQDLDATAARAAAYRDTIVPRARQVLEGAEFAFGRGAMALADLIDARRTLHSVLLEEVAARADHGRALAAWQLRSQPAD